MKLTAEKQDLVALLGRVKSAVEKRNTIAALANVALTASGDTLKAKATDLDMEITSQCRATIQIEGETTVSADMLAQAIGKMPNGSLVTLAMDKGTLVVYVGRSRYKLETLPIEEFPVMADDTYDGAFTVSGPDIAKLFGLTRFAMSTEETRYYLQGVYLHPQDGLVIGAATDGHKLAKVTVKCDADFSGVIVPKKTVNAIVGIADISDISVSVSATKIRFDMGDTVIVSKVIDGTFPDYTRVIPSALPNIVEANAAKIKAATDRVSIISADARTKAVKLDIAADAITFTTNGNGQNEAVDVVEVSYDGTPMTIGFNAAYLAAIMAQCSGDDFTMYLGSPSDPVKVTPRGDDSEVYVCMPMRV